MANSLDLGIDFTNMQEVGIADRPMSSAATDFITEDVPQENIGSGSPNDETAAVEKPKDGEAPVVQEFNINDFLSGIDNNTEDVGKLKEVTKDESKPTKEEISKEKSPSSTKQQTSSNVPFTLVFKSLLEEGALTEFDQETFEAQLNDPEVGPALAIQSVFKREAEIVKQDILSEAQEDFKEYTSLLDAGVNREVANQIIQQQSLFSKLTEADIEGDSEQAINYRKMILAQNLRNSTNFSNDKITKMVEKSVKLGDDEEEAKEALPMVNQYNAQLAKQAKDQAMKQEADRKTAAIIAINKYKETIKNTDEVIPGQKINKQTKDKIQDYVLNGKLWDIRKQDPYKFDTMVSYLALNGLFEGKFDKPIVKAKTAAITEMENVLRTTSKSGVSPVTTYAGATAPDEEADENQDFVADLLRRQVGKKK